MNTIIVGKKSYYYNNSEIPTIIKQAQEEKTRLYANIAYSIDGFQAIISVHRTEKEAIKTMQTAENLRKTLLTPLKNKIELFV